MKARNGPRSRDGQAWLPGNFSTVVFMEPRPTTPPPPDADEAALRDVVEREVRMELDKRGRLDGIEFALRRHVPFAVVYEVLEGLAAQGLVESA